MNGKAHFVKSANIGGFTPIFAVGEEGSKQTVMRSIWKMSPASTGWRPAAKAGPLAGVIVPADTSGQAAIDSAQSEREQFATDYEWFAEHRLLEAAGDGFHPDMELHGMGLK